MRPGARLGAVMLSAHALTSVANADAQGPAPDDQVNATYLFNFTKFTEWPSATWPPGAPIHVCIAGRDPFGDSLGTLEGKTVRSHPLHDRHDQRADTLRGCHVVFVAGEDDRSEQSVVRSAEAVSALTVSDREGFAQRRGTIGMLARERRILLDVDVEGAQRAGLRLSSQMLKLARSVKGRP